MFIGLCFTVLTTFFEPGMRPGWFIEDLPNTPVYTWQSDEHMLHYITIGDLLQGNTAIWRYTGECVLNNKMYPVYKFSTVNHTKK